MRTTRIYTPQPLQAGTETELDSAASNYLSRVLRLKPGTPVVLFDGSGGEYHGNIRSLDKRAARIGVEEFIAREAESTLRILLGQGLSRGEHMDYTVRKATELGVEGIAPLLTEHCNVRLDERRSAVKTTHWRKIVISACEQCGRNRLPGIAEPVTLSRWLQAGPPGGGAGYVLHPGADTGLGSLDRPTGTVSILAGPEGGLSDAEVEQARAAGFTPVHLGPRILRTETAALTAISALQAMWGDMR